VRQRISSHLLLRWRFWLRCGALILRLRGKAIASVAGCDSGPMQMAGCDQFLCGLQSSANLLSQGALASARYDLSKSIRALFLGDLSSDSSKQAAFTTGIYKFRSIRFFAARQRYFQDDLSRCSWHEHAGPAATLRTAEVVSGSLSRDFLKTIQGRNTRASDRHPAASGSESQPRHPRESEI
jgi:hypothetical protein